MPPCHSYSVKENNYNNNNRSYQNTPQTYKKRTGQDKNTKEEFLHQIKEIIKKQQKKAQKKGKTLPLTGINPHSKDPPFWKNFPLRKEKANKKIKKSNKHTKL